MAQEVHSIWSEIKKYEDILVKDPRSFCFAQLSELYRKIGLLDDAIFVANRGVEIHPEYVGGLLALGRAYLEKGLKANSREALERVAAMAPDNYIAHKLLSLMYLEQNERVLAQKTLGKVLELNPGDVECRVSLEALSRSAESDVASPQWQGNEEDLEEADIVDDDLLLPEGWSDGLLVSPPERDGAGAPAVPPPDLAPWETGTVAAAAGEGAERPVAEPPGADLLPDLLAGLPTPEESPGAASPAAGGDAAPEADLFAALDEWSTGTVPEPAPAAEAPRPADAGRNPLSTATLAEIYLSQGFHAQALTIYRELLRDEPDSARLRQRIADIETLQAGAAGAADAPTGGRTSGAPEPSPADAEAGRKKSLAALDDWLRNIEKRRL